MYNTAYILYIWKLKDLLCVASLYLYITVVTDNLVPNIFPVFEIRFFKVIHETKLCTSYPHTCQVLLTIDLLLSMKNIQYVQVTQQLAITRQKCFWQDCLYYQFWQFSCWQSFPLSSAQCTIHKRTYHQILASRGGIIKYSYEDISPNIGK